MKIFHFADLHLDSPFVGMSREFSTIQPYLVNSAYEAFSNGVSVAINRQVDVVVIVGDVYDAKKQTVYAQHFFHQQLERLNQAHIPVIFSHGNHDFMSANIERRQYPENVHVFRNNSVSYFDLDLKNGETARFYGFSYKTMWIKERVIDQYPTNPHETTYTIGLLHGDTESEHGQAGQYAPFSVKDLLEKNYSYWALGHIHMANVLNEQPLIQYSGTIQGRHRNEHGPKGAYIVDLAVNQPTKSEFIPLATIIWQKVVIECRYQLQAVDLVEQIQKTLDNYYQDGLAHDLSYILDIELDHAERLDYQLQEQIMAGELMETVQSHDDGEPFAIVGNIRMTRQIQVSPFEYDKSLNQSFKEAYNTIQQADNFNKIMSPLKKHPTVQSYLLDLINDPDLKEEILLGGHDLVIQSLGFEEEGGAETNEN